MTGVDILRSARGTLVIEVNSSPGLEGIEATSGKDIATAMIEYIEEKVETHAREVPDTTKSTLLCEIP